MRPAPCLAHHAILEPDDTPEVRAIKRQARIALSVALYCKSQKVNHRRNATLHAPLLWEVEAQAALLWERAEDQAWALAERLLSNVELLAGEPADPTAEPAWFSAGLEERP